MREACDEKDPAHKEEEFGDLLFAVINAARLWDVDPEAALNASCAKFRRRFTYLEENTIRKGRQLSEMSLAQMRFGTKPRPRDFDFAGKG